MAERADSAAGYKEAQARIAAARRDGATELNLSILSLWNNELTTLPPEIASLTALQKLDLGGNHLTALPPEIGSLTALQALSLTHNQLATLPPVIASLTALQTLDLSDNQLTTLPPEIGSLTALQTLYLSRNRLNTLPPTIGHLTALQTLWLTGNQLTRLPPEIGSLTNLQRLDVDRNRLTTLPPEIGLLIALHTLRVDRNQLTTLPPQIGSLTALRMLFLHGNSRLGIPPEVLGPTWQECRRLGGKEPAAPRAILYYYFKWARTRGELSSAAGSSAEPPEKPAVVYYAVESHHDRDATADEAALDVMSYARVLAKLMDRSEGNVCFGLLGHWGRGKTYLMDRIRDVLVPNDEYGKPRARWLEHDYTVVKFSAWAYPHAPLLWVYLYETLAKAASKCGRAERIARILRTAVLRHGVYQLAGAIIGLAMITIFLKELGAVGTWIGRGALGASGITVLLGLWKSSSTIATTTTAKFAALSNHDEKLGLQAMIGKDLLALLIGWIPGDKANWPEELRRQFGWTRFLGYLIACFSLEFAVWWAFGEWMTKYATVLGLYASPLGLILAGTTLSIAFWTWLAMATDSKQKRRVLLYVDDLDRCEPEKMLEVMEGLMQFLESNQISERLQIVMLVDEAALTCAILNKYGHIAELGSGISVPTRRQIAIENIEKLFVGYLVLPPLSEAELSQVAQRHFDELQKKNKLGKPASKPVAVATPRPIAPDREDKADLPELPNRRPAETLEPQLEPHGAPVIYGFEESKTLEAAMARLAQTRRSRPGPRSVRGLLFRYQLARNLFLERNRRGIGSWDRQNAQALVDAIMAADANQEMDGVQLDFSEIASQVSLSIR